MPEQTPKSQKQLWHHSLWDCCFWDCVLGYELGMPEIQFQLSYHSFPRQGSVK